MALAHVQSMLARIYTDKELRQKFLLNPFDVATEYHLEDSEIEQVIDLSKDQVESFSVSLIYKRLGEIRKKLPFTARLLGKKFSRLFFQYAQASTPRGIKKHLDDTFLFAAYIKRMAAQEKVDPWVVEVLQYEVNGIKAVVSAVSASFMIFHYDIRELVDLLLKDGQIQPSKRLRMALWVKYLPSKRIFHIII